MFSNIFLKFYSTFENVQIFLLKFNNIYVYSFFRNQNYVTRTIFLLSTIWDSQLFLTKFSSSIQIHSSENVSIVKIELIRRL